MLGLPRKVGLFRPLGGIVILNLNQIKEVEINGFAVCGVKEKAGNLFAWIDDWLQVESSSSRHSE